MKIFNFFSVCFLIVCFVGCGFSQNEKGLTKYLEIKVFVSTLQDVEKIYGKGETSVNKYFVQYKNSEDFILVSYSSRNCQSKYPRWNVSDWSVEEVTYTPQKSVPKLNDLISNKKNFKKRQRDHVTHLVEYFNDKNGITIYYDTLNNEVREIKIRPSLSDEEKYGCK